MSALDFLNPLDCARVPGGCEDCDAEAVVDATDAPVYRISVHHDATFPAYQAMRDKDDLLLPGWDS